MKIKPGDFFIIRWKRNKSFQVYIADDKNVWFFDERDNEWCRSSLITPNFNLNLVNSYKIYKGKIK